MGLERLFAPRSIVVFGASDNPTAVSWRIMTSLQRLGFPGDVYPVNPKRRDVLGRRCYASLDEVPFGVDAIAFCVGRDLVDQNIMAAAQRGIGGAAIFDTGFAEAGAAGSEKEERVRAAAATHGMAVVGPNGMGILNPATRSTLYSGLIENPDRLAGNVGVVTQSGAIAVGLLTDCRRFGFSHIVSSGNEGTTRLHEFVDYLIDDDATRVIALFVEAVRDLPNFVRSLDRAFAAGKPVVVLKVGKSSRGKRAVMGHTGAVAGAGDAFSALLRRHRAVEVDSPEALGEVLAACQSDRLPAGPRIGHITASGGQVDLIHDIVERHGYQLPELQPETKAGLTNGTGITLSDGNPLDAWGDGDWRRNLPLALERLAADPNVDNVVFTSDTADGQPMAPTNYVGLLKEAAARSHKPHVFFNTRPAHFRQANVDALRGTGAAVIGGIEQGLGAIHKLGIAATTPAPRPRQPHELPRLDAAMLSRPSIGEADAKRLMEEAGLSCPREIVCDSEAELGGAAARIGYPVVLKVVSDDIPHRSDLGLVEVGIGSLDALRVAFARMRDTVAGLTLSEPARYLVAEQIKGGVEVLVGVNRDPELGAYLLLGPGGVWVELLRDTAVRPLPLFEGDVEAMIAETRLGALLAGFRGAPPSDVSALVAAVERVADLGWAWRGQIESFDLNPVVVLDVGKGVRIVDAVIFPARDG